MRTTSKKYHFTIYAGKDLPGIYEGGVNKFSCNCKSIQSAENYARKIASIGADLAKPIRCEITYKTQRGIQTREITF